LVFVLDDFNPVAAKIFFTANLRSPDHLKDELLLWSVPSPLRNNLRIFRPQYRFHKNSTMFTQKWG